MKKFIILILILLAGIGLLNSMFELAILAIGYPVDYVIYSGIYLKYILFIIPLLFVVKMCVGALKKYIFVGVLYQEL